MKKIIVRALCTCMLLSVSFYSFALGHKDDGVQMKTKKVIDHTKEEVVIPITKPSLSIL